MEPRNFLEELGEKYKPSKRKHDYLKHYWTHFRDIRNNVKRVCEIGVQTAASLKMWEEFFPNAVIYGIDVNPQCKALESGRCKIFIGSQADEVFLQKFLQEIGGPLDILIDDGSHVAEHQIFTFQTLFPMLNEHGIYVMEDTGGCVGDISLQTINHIKKLIDNIMHWPKQVTPGNWSKLWTFPEGASWFDRNVVGTAFYRWIAFVMRGKNPEDNPYLDRSR